MPLVIPMQPNEVWSADFMPDALWSGRRVRTFTSLCMDKGLELISDELEKWARRRRIERRFMQPRRPMQNGLIERFSRTYREEVLDCYVFETLSEVRRMTADWITRYNVIRPLESLGDIAARQ